MLRLSLALAAVFLAGPAFAAGVHHDLDVALDPPARRLEVRDRMTLPAGPHSFLLAPELTVAEVTVGGRPLDFQRQGGTLTLTVPAGAADVTVRYAGTLAPLTPNHKGGGAAAGEEGAYLPGGPAWLPTSDEEPPTWRLSVRVPPPFIAVATGALVEEVRHGGYRAVFAEDRTVDAPSLFAGKWEVRERRLGSLRLRTYFEPELNHLSDEFLDLTQRAIDTNSARIGAYPFAGFSIVSAPLPVGLGFPGLTYIGRTVLPLPFVRGQSLAHEILHNWWGNGVRVAYEQGNWSEGLTTYMADYAAAEERGPEAAQAMRLDWLRDYAALPPERDTPVSAFKSKVHDASQIVGYGKVAMIFHMLRAELGEDTFAAGIRRIFEQYRFKDAGWSDLRMVFEQVSGRDLGPFFAQWVERPGAPTLRLPGASVQGDHVAVTLRQDQPVYALSVPVVVETSTGTQRHMVRLEGREASASLPFTGTLKSVAVDPGYDLFRRLAPGEAPPILRDVTLDGDASVVVAAEGEAAEAGRALVERLMDRKVQVVAPDRTDPAEPLALIGTTDAVERLLRAYRLGETPASLANRGTARVWTTRNPLGKPVLVVEAADGAALRALLRPLPHYGRQSWLVFEGGKMADRGVWPAGDSPLRKHFE
ncbi:MAG TPA: M1 family aminopeptidase [Azospirillum sp.]|nr:M1 family aminopeptidase [Azospirillum sp.]